MRTGLPYELRTEAEKKRFDSYIVTENDLKGRIAHRVARLLMQPIKKRTNKPARENNTVYCQLFENVGCQVPPGLGASCDTKIWKSRNC